MSSAFLQSTSFTELLPSMQELPILSSSSSSLSSSSTTTSSTSLPSLSQPSWNFEIHTKVVTLLVLILVTLIGNCTLIVVLVRHRGLRRKRVSVFLVNLAVADLLVCLVTMTSELFFVGMGEWVLGAVGCKAVVYCQIVTLASTTFLLTSMSIDQFQVIVRPLRTMRQGGPPRIRYKVIISWVAAFVLALPQLFIFVEVTEPSPTSPKPLRVCKSNGYSAPWQRKVYFTFMTTYILVIPTVVMTTCYVCIIRAVWLRTTSSSSFTSQVRHTTAVTGSPLSNPRSISVVNDVTVTLDSERSSNTLNTRGSMEAISFTRDRLKMKPHKLIVSSKRNVVKMTLSVIVCFIACWAPYFITNLIRIYSDYTISLSLGKSISEVITLTHSALNPILYMLFSSRTILAVCCQKGQTTMNAHRITWSTSLRIPVPSPRHTSLHTTPRLSSTPQTYEKTRIELIHIFTAPPVLSINFNPVSTDLFRMCIVCKQRATLNYRPNFSLKLCPT